VELCFGNQRHRIDLLGLTGKRVMVYGQTEVTRDLMAARSAAGLPTVYEADEVAVQGFDSAQPSVSYVKDGVRHTVQADFIAGCDGFHGVCRASVPRQRDHAASRRSTPSAGWACWPMCRRSATS
jgi:p-hydroxybenzoate 3-monooxygenase